MPSTLNHTIPAVETAKLIREYAQWAIDNTTADDEAPDPLLLAIVKTDATMADACCHMGRALLCIEHGLEDPPYRLGGDMCDPRVTIIAARLGWTA